MYEIMNLIHQSIIRACCTYGFKQICIVYRTIYIMCSYQAEIHCIQYNYCIVIL